MSFRLELGDITEIKADAIVNSLGPKGSIYGRLCKAILNKAEDENIKSTIDSIENGIPGTTYLTKAGKLPSKYIIHVITPYKKDDDKDNTKLVDCYRNAINLAIKNGYKSIGLPLIGSIASGYSDSESYNALLEASREIDDREEKENKDLIEMIAVSFLKKRSYYGQNLDDFMEDERRFIFERNLQKEDRDYKEEARHLYSKFPFDVFSCCKVFSEVKAQETIMLDVKEYGQKYDPKYPYNFLLYLFEQRGTNERKELAPICDHDHRKKFKELKSLQNKDIIQLSVLAGLNTTEILEWMAVAGNSLSPFSRIDRAIVLLMRRGMFEDIYFYSELLSFFEEKLGIRLTFNNLNKIEEKLDNAWRSKGEIADLMAQNGIIKEG